MTIRSLEANNPKIDASAYVDETALVIGDVAIGADSSIWPMTVVRGDVHSITIGARTNIQDGAILHVTHESDYGGAPLVIGDDVTAGHGVVLHACTVEGLCLIGIGTIILDGAVVGRQAMIGAGSLIPPGKHLPGGYLYVGRPAVRKRALTAGELQYLEYSARHYVEVKNRHAGSG